MLAQNARVAQEQEHTVYTIASSGGSAGFKHPWNYGFG